MKENKDIIIGTGNFATTCGRIVKHTLAERKRYWASKLRRCENPNEDVLSIYHGITSNGCKPMLLEGDAIERMLAKYGDHGFVIVSAARRENSQEVNIERTKDLRNKIASNGYPYLPAYRGYKNTETAEEEVYEPSFFVFNCNKEGESLDVNKLVALAKQWCGDYNQDFVYVKLPGKNPVCMDRDGVVADNRNGVGVNIDDFKKNHEWYTNPIPATLNEMQRRMATHEVIIWV